MEAKMMTVEEVRKGLQERNVQVVARHTGLNPHTIYRLINEDRKPSYETVKVLSDYLTQERANG
jgi:DNA-binding phage protein